MPESQRIALLQRGMRRPSVHEQYVCTVALEHEDGTVEPPDRTNPSGPAGIATPAGLLPFVTAPHLRPLPSTGITRRPQYYYGPLRHPADPACPSRGSGCCVHNIEQSFPCCCFLHLPHVPTPIPRRKRFGACVAHFPIRHRPSPFPRRVGFRIARFEACTAFTMFRPVMVAEPPKAALRHQSASVCIVTSANRPGCYQRERQLCRYRHSCRFRLS